MAIASSDVTTDPQNVASENIYGRADDVQLVSWVMSRVVRWRTTRDSNYFDLWDQYFALWRGQWNSKLKQRESERSKLITPATQQAVDATVSEMVEATFGRGAWFDIRDEQDPQKRQIAEAARDQLLSDLSRDRIKHAVMETYLNGAIYGTGIAKRIVENRTLYSYNLDFYGNTIESPIDTICVYWQSIPPYNFVIDTAALTIEDALGVAHETIRPIAEIEARQASGEYYNVPIGSASGYATGIIARGPKGENLEVNILDGTYITEYHGRVPAKYLAKDSAEIDNPEVQPYPDQQDQYGQQDGDKMELPQPMVEAIVVIANGNALLKKEKNPFPGGDRGFIAYQHDRVPNRFWGRGVCEKAYNAQLALDAEMRARIDAMALMTYPMVGFDATRLPRNINLQVRPGKAFLTNGDPETIIRPIAFDNLNPSWFQHSSDLERMVAVSTGTFDPGSPGPQYANNGTASGASMAMGSMIKRAKLTMQTVDQDFLDPLIKKTYVAYQTLDPEKYPHLVDFEINSSMSIMAREFEQTQMTNLLAIIPPQSPAFMIILRSIAENYSGPSRAILINAIEGMMKPDPQQQQMQQMQAQAQVRGMMAEVAKLEAEVRKINSEVPVNQAKIRDLLAKAATEPAKVQVQQAQTALEARKVEAAERQEHMGHMHDHLHGAQENIRHHKDHLADLTKHAMDYRLGMSKLAVDKYKADKQAEAAKEQAKIAMVKAQQPKGPSNGA